MTSKELGPEVDNALALLDAHAAVLNRQIRKARRHGLSYTEGTEIMACAALIREAAAGLNRACTPDGNR